MRLYLVRHGDAVSDQENRLRPLSERGHDELRRMAQLLRSSRAFTPEQLWHSPLLRARETAEGLLRAVVPDAVLIETPGLLPEDDPEEIAGRLRTLTTIEHLALVGHEPHLSALATLLVRGKKNPVGFEMKKGAILALEPTGDAHKKTGAPRWFVRWLLPPTLVPPS
jgi:phosphohistidine phosphatase